MPPKAAASNKRSNATQQSEPEASDAEKHLDKMPKAELPAVVPSQKAGIDDKASFSIRVEKITCPTCTLMYTDGAGEHAPRSLSCGHTCCSRCLGVMLTFNRFSCPRGCGKAARPAAVENVAINWDVVELVEDYSAPPVEPTPAAIASSSASVAIPKCSRHPDFPLIFWCVGCGVDICPHCAATTHKTHETCESHDIVSRGHVDLVNWTQQAEKITSEAEKAGEVLDSLDAKVIANVSGNFDRMRHAELQMIEDIKARGAAERDQYQLAADSIRAGIPRQKAALLAHAEATCAAVKKLQTAVQMKSAGGTLQAGVELRQLTTQWEQESKKHVAAAENTISQLSVTIADNATLSTAVGTSISTVFTRHEPTVPEWNPRDVKSSISEAMPKSDHLAFEPVTAPSDSFHMKIFANKLYDAVATGNNELITKMLTDYPGLRACKDRFNNWSLILYQGNSLLHNACSRGLSQTAMILIKFEMSVHEKNLNNAQPLKFAIASGDLKTVRLLLDHGAHVSNVDLEGDCAMTVALTKQDPVMVKLLLEKGAHFSCHHRSKEHPLAYAAARGCTQIVKQLLLAGARAREQCARTLDALNRAVENDCPEVVKVLIRWGAQPNLVQFDGKSAMDRAILLKRDEICTTLKTVGLPLPGDWW